VEFASAEPRQTYRRYLRYCLHRHGRAGYSRLHYRRRQGKPQQVWLLRNPDYWFPNPRRPRLWSWPYQPSFAARWRPERKHISRGQTSHWQACPHCPAQQARPYHLCEVHLCRPHLRQPARALFAIIFSRRPFCGIS